MDDALAAELGERLGRLGHDGALPKALDDWAGAANLEERVDGAERIDPECSPPSASSRASAKARGCRASVTNR